MTDIPMDGLIAHFPMNGDLFDQVSGRTAENSGIKFVPDSQFGQVAVFNGASRAAFEMTEVPDGDFSILLMLRTTANNSEKDAFSFGSDGELHAAAISFFGSNFAIERGSGAFHSTAAVADGAWHLCAATVSGITLTMYVDGQQVQMIYTGSPFDFSSGTVAIGSWIYPGYYYNGLACHAMIYNRTLNASEITGIHETLIATATPPSAPAVLSPILLVPSSTAPATGTRGVLFGNLFLPLSHTSGMPTEGLVFHASLAGPANTAETGQTLTQEGNVYYTMKNGVPCARFGGDWSKIGFPDAGLPAGNAPRTLACHYRTITGAPDNMICVEYGTNEEGHLCNLFAYPNSQRIEVGRRDATVISDAQSANLEEWSLIAATFDGSTATLYYNGQAIKSSPFSFNTELNRGYIGYRDDYGQLTGYIAGVRIYNRALSASEIATLATEFRR
ncbi:MAG: LamG domain-containing protein [Lentisphaeria bacterium]|nr:LamG domain-containing protein [Lentisphaeria bacterium]